MKFPGGKCLVHCVRGHPKNELVVYRLNSRRTGYIATHYGLVPSENGLSSTDLEFDEDTYKVKYSTRAGITTPISKACRFSATPPQGDHDETLPYEEDDHYLETLAHATFVYYAICLFEN